LIVRGWKRRWQGNGNEGKGGEGKGGKERMRREPSNFKMP